MDAGAILKRLSDLGVSATVSGDRLHLRPGSLVPTGLVEELRAHKDLLRGYRLKYTGTQAGDAELEEIADGVRSQGYVLVWSSVLQDLGPSTGMRSPGAGYPKGFVPYSEQELRELFREGGSAPPASTLRLVHKAKRHGGRIVGHG